MGVMDSYRKFLESSKKYNEVSKMRDKSFKIIEYSNYYSMDELTRVVQNDWYDLFESLYMHVSYRKIRDELERLKESYINREQFFSKVKSSCEELNEKISALKQTVEKEEKEFSDSYDIFFSTGLNNANDLSTKMIYSMFMQPEAKEVLMEFLKT